MPVIEISNYYAEWKPSGNAKSAGVGKIILKNAVNASDLYYLNNLGVDDFRNTLQLLQTEKPIFWESEVKYLRTAHMYSPVAEPVGKSKKT